MRKISCSFMILCISLLFWSPAEAKTVYTCRWQTSVEIPFKYSSYLTTGEHGLILEGKQTGLQKDGVVNYALVTNGTWSDRLISFNNVYGETNFKIKLKAPKGTKCKIRIFIYGGGVPKGILKVSRY